MLLLYGDICLCPHKPVRPAKQSLTSCRIGFWKPKSCFQHFDRHWRCGLCPVLDMICFGNPTETFLITPTKKIFTKPSASTVATEKTNCRPQQRSPYERNIAPLLCGTGTLCRYDVTSDSGEADVHNFFSLGTWKSFDCIASRPSCISNLSMIWSLHRQGTSSSLPHRYIGVRQWCK